jgi:hypothetical protein
LRLCNAFEKNEKPALNIFTSYFNRPASAGFFISNRVCRK